MSNEYSPSGKCKGVKACGQHSAHYGLIGLMRPTATGASGVVGNNQDYVSRPGWLRALSVGMAEILAGGYSVSDELLEFSNFWEAALLFS